MSPDGSIIHKAVFKENALPIAYIFTGKECFALWANNLVRDGRGIFIG